MRDDHQDHRRGDVDPIEHELGDRLLRSDPPVVGDDDAQELRDAASWVGRVDDLVAESSPIPADEGPAPETVRDGVLSRIGSRPTPAARRSPAPRMPWWRRVAPVAVAASLVGLFLWRASDDGPPPPPSPVEMQVEHAPSEPAAIEDAPGAIAEEPREEESAANSGLSTQTFSQTPERAKSLSSESPEMRRERAPTPGTMPELRVGPPLDVEAESLLARLDRLQPASAPYRSAQDRLRSIRNAIEDSVLAARADSVLAGPRR